MRIKEFLIDGFGLFHQVGLRDLPPGLLLFTGPNEAGKSTLLGFFRALLFGFPDGRSRENAYPPLAGGRHGGSMTLLTDGGREVILRRSPGPRGGRLEIEDAAGGALPERELLHLLGGANRQLYSNVFAFSLSELQQLETLFDSGAGGSAIYAAGSGASAAALARAERQLAGELEQLFRPRGRKDEVHALLRELEQVRGELAQAETEQQGYQALTEKISTRREELEQVLRELRQLNREVRRVEVDQRLFRPALEWRRLQQEERGPQPPPTFRPEHPEREEAAQRALAQAQRAVAAAEVRLRRLNGKLERISVDPALLARAERIGALREAHGEFAAARRERERLLPAIALNRREQQRVLEYLGEPWDEARLAEVAETCASFAARAELRHCEAARRERAEALRSATAEVQRLAQESADAARELADEEKAAADFANGPQGPQAEARRERGLADWVALAEKQAALAEQAATLAEEQAQRERAATPWAPPWLAAALTGGGVAVGAATAGGWWLRQSTGSPTGLPDGSPLSAWLGAGTPEVLIGLALAGLFLLLVAAGLWFFDLRGRPRRDDPALRKKIAALRDTLAAVERELGEKTGALGLPAETDPALGRHLLAESRAALAAANARVTAGEEQLRRSRSRLERLETRLAEARAHQEQARAAAEQATADWKALLARLRMPAACDLTDAQELLEQIQRWEELSTEQRKLTEARERLEQRIEQFRGVAETLFGELGIDPPDPALYGPALKQLGDRLQAAEEAAAKRDQLNEEAQDLKLELQTAEEERAQRQTELETVWAECGVADAAAFAQAADAWRATEERRQRENSLRAQLLDLAAASTWPPVEEHVQRLEGMQAEELAQQAGELLERQRALEERRDTIQTELGRLQGERERLADSDTLFARRMEEERLLARLRGKAAEWSETALTQHLLRRAKERFEERHQPAVVRHAGRFFEKMTAGRYRRLIAPPGAQRIEAVTAAGERRDSTELSRGTAEQLYLALRFGFLQNHAAHGETLPLVMDDVLVNFDPERAAHAAAAIRELAVRGQILFFSCHPESIALFHDQDPELPLFTIAGGTIQATR